MSVFKKDLKFDLVLVRSSVQNPQDILLWLDQRGGNSNSFAYSFLGYSEDEFKQLKDKMFCLLTWE